MNATLRVTAHRDGEGDVCLVARNVSRSACHRRDAKREREAGGGSAGHQDQPGRVARCRWSGVGDICGRGACSREGGELNA